jgi:hypothetical protein
MLYPENDADRLRLELADLAVLLSRYSDEQSAVARRLLRQLRALGAQYRQAAKQVSKGRKRVVRATRTALAARLAARGVWV